MSLRVTLWAALAVLLTTLAGWIAYPYLATGSDLGRLEARRDIRAGKLQLRHWPAKDGGGERPEVPDDVRQRLNVTYEVNGHGCVIDDRWYQMKGYNEVMLAEIERRAKQLPAATK